MDDWTDAFGTHDAPDKECHSGGWRDDGLEGEKVPTERGFVSITNVDCALVTRMWSTVATYILWIGNQIAGREISQKRKKQKRSLVVVPNDAGIEFAAR